MVARYTGQLWVSPIKLDIVYAEIDRTFQALAFRVLLSPGDSNLQSQDLYWSIV